MVFNVRTRLIRIALIVAMLAVYGAVLPASAAQSDRVPARYIVTFESGAEGPALEHIGKLGGVKVKDLPLVNGAAVMLPDKAAEAAVGRVKGVKYVEPDVIVYATGKPTKPAPEQPTQIVPWGIARIGATPPMSTTADVIKVAIVDTGIDLTHPDLAANIKGGISTVSYTRRYTDDNGHGTHVAGIVAALNNTIGVVGVGPDIDLYAVKVLSRSGSGYVSDIISGLGWCQTNGINVVNMSLGTTVDVQSLHTAVDALYASGTVIVAAAGNDGIGSPVNYPAAYDSVVAVSATTQSDALAYFTNTGPQIELSAPGYQIPSTYKGGTYSTLSGTSMASPHVAGVAALAMSRPVGTWDTNTNGRWDPPEVRTRLNAATVDLGPAGWDPGYGYGLIQASMVAPK